MIEVTKRQKDYLQDKMPNIKVVVLNRQKCNQKKYLVQEDKHTAYWLSRYEKWLRTGIDEDDRPAWKGRKAYGK